MANLGDGTISETFSDTLERYFRMFPDAYWPDSRGMSYRDYIRLEDYMLDAMDAGEPFGPEDLQDPVAESDPSAGLVL